jgi:hypothetical protein
MQVYFLLSFVSWRGTGFSLTAQIMRGEKAR